MSKKQQQDRVEDDGRRTEISYEGNIMVETVRDADGNVISVTKWVKPELWPGRRENGPAANEERRPL